VPTVGLAAVNPLSISLCSLGDKPHAEKRTVVTVKGQ
jgi:hypothetical protein